MGRILDLSERLILVLLFAALANATIRSGAPANFLLLTTEGMSVFFILIRRQAISASTEPLDWALALGGAMLPLMVRPAPGPLVPEFVGATLMAVGVLVTIAAKLSLNRRFGLAPANRGIQGAWAYSVVRHPMYAGYIIVQVGFLLTNPSLYNLCVYLVAWSVQVARLFREERWLLTDPEYQAYAERVRFRLIPGIF